jgi:hypothetical protein
VLDGYESTSMTVTAAHSLAFCGKSLPRKGLFERGSATDLDVVELTIVKFDGRWRHRGHSGDT